MNNKQTIIKRVKNETKNQHIFLAISICFLCVCFETKCKKDAIIKVINKLINKNVINIMWF